MTGDMLPDYPLIMRLINENPEQLGLKCKQSRKQRWSKKDV
jgi:hypothetical protein